VAVGDASRWILMEKTTPSGKVLFKCLSCGRESPTPDRRCPLPSCSTYDEEAEREASRRLKETLRRGRLWR
jgi:hypothetical protein